MKVIKNCDEEPMWDRIGQSSCDFRPTFDGDLVNLFTCINPEPTVSETEAVLVHHTREIARWIISHRKRFSPGDRFQIIVGWPMSVRVTGRQVIKMGGDFDAVASIANGATKVVPMPGWTNQVFEKEDTEP